MSVADDRLSHTQRELWTRTIRRHARRLLAGRDKDIQFSITYFKSI